MKKLKRNMALIIIGLIVIVIVVPVYFSLAALNWDIERITTLATATPY